MTEVEQQDTSNIFSIEEIHEMFDSGFLSKLQEIGGRVKDVRFPEKEIAYFAASLVMRIPPTDEPLTYASIQDHIQFQLQPILQEDIDKAEAEKAEEDGESGNDEPS